MATPDQKSQTMVEEGSAISAQSHVKSGIISLKNLEDVVAETCTDYAAYVDTEKNEILSQNVTLFC